MSPYQPDFDIDLKWGERQELQVLGILSAIQNGARVEVKSDAYLNDRFFLEVQDRRRGRVEWRDTGFRTSKADLIVLNKPGLNGLHIFRMEDLRDLEAHGALGPLRDGGTRGDCPTKGYVVTIAQLTAGLAWLAKKNRDPLYGEQQTL